MIGFGSYYLFFRSNPASFSDEPKIENKYFHVTSSTLWVTPTKDLMVFKAKNLLSFKSPSAKEIKVGWLYNQDYPEQYQILAKLHLEKKYFNYFFDNGDMPYLAFAHDVNGDGIQDKAYISAGAGCGSCHEGYIDIFIGNKVYNSEANEVGIYPRNDSSGFYVTEQVPGQDYSSPSSIIIHKFQWNGNGFTEIARKTDQILLKKQ